MVNRKKKLQDDKASERKVNLSNLTTHLEQLSLWSQTKVMGGSSGR